MSREAHLFILIASRDDRFDELAPARSLVAAKLHGDPVIPVVGDVPEDTAPPSTLAMLLLGIMGREDDETEALNMSEPEPNIAGMTMPPEEGRSMVVPPRSKEALADLM